MTLIGWSRINIFQNALCNWGITAFINHHAFGDLTGLESYCSSSTATPPQATLKALSLDNCLIVTFILRLCQSDLFVFASSVFHCQRGGNAGARPRCLAMLTPQAGVVAAIGVQCDRHAEE